MHVSSIMEELLNAIQNEKLKQKIQISITLLHILSLITVVYKSLLFRNV